MTDPEIDLVRIEPQAEADAFPTVAPESYTATKVAPLGGRIPLHNSLDGRHSAWPPSGMSRFAILFLRKRLVLHAARPVRHRKNENHR